MAPLGLGLGPLSTSYILLPSNFTQYLHDFLVQSSDSPLTTYCYLLRTTAHTSIREATFTLGVGSKGITWVTEWAPLGSLSEGEHTVWAFGQSLSNGVGARPITLLAVIESGDTCRTTQRTVSTVNLHSEVDSELTQLLLLIQIRQKVH